MSEGESLENFAKGFSESLLEPFSNDAERNLRGVVGLIELEAELAEGIYEERVKRSSKDLKNILDNQKRRFKLHLARYSEIRQNFADSIGNEELIDADMQVSVAKHAVASYHKFLYAEIKNKTYH